MATQHAHKAARLMVSPSVILLLAWMIIPLGTTIYFSFLRYSILTPPASWTGFDNYYYFLTDPAFGPALINTLTLVLGVLFITTVGGILLALLLNMEFWGQGIVRVLVISPFFVMPTVSALIWKNMFMNPVNGLFAHMFRALGMQPVDFLATIPLLSVIIMVAWAWLPFATLILLTALQSLDSEQMEAAEMDGASWLSRFIYLTLPHLTRSITVVVLIQTIFLLAVFAEIYVTTAGGPGYASTNLPFMIYNVSLKQFDAGLGAAGGIIAVIIANIVAFFLMRAVGKNLEL